MYMRVCVYLCLTEGSVQALACYIWTSESGGRQLVPAAPWCCPCVPRLRSGSPDHRAPSPACKVRERETEREREMLAKEKNQWRQIRRCGWRTTTTKSERKQQFLLFYESSLHMSGLMCHHKCRGETILMVQRAAPYWMAHACHRGVT